MRAIVAAALLAVAVSGCLDRSRFNATCTWAEPAATPLRWSTSPDRHHLRDDGLLAEELGIRQGDSLFPAQLANQLPIRRACEESSFATIARIHRVPVDTVHAVRLERDLRVDAAAVLLPMVVLYLLLGRWLAILIRRTYEEHGKAVTIAITAAASLAFSGLFLMFGAQWAWLVEMVRLGDSHISFRAGRLPWIPWRGEIFLLGVVAFPVIAWHRWRRRPWPA